MNPKKLIFPVSMIIPLILGAKSVLAHCPLCTAATGAAVVVTRYYGLNDIIVGLFIGGFLISMALWFNNLLRKKRIKIPLQGAILVILSVGLTLAGFITAGMTKNIYNRLFGINTLVLGTILGSIIALIVTWLSKYLIKKRGKAFFPFQTIIFNIIILAIAAGIFYFVLK